MSRTMTQRVTPVSLTIGEGSSGNFTVQLATQPSENVTITLSGTDGTDLSLDKTSLTFTATNWNMAQTVIVNAGEDNDTLADSAVIDLSASGADYGSITGSVTVNVSDNDTADLTLSTSSISITEGSSGNFTVQLATQPSENVTITLSGTDGTDLSLDKTSLTFTATNWNMAQTVIVNAGEDNDTLADSAVIDLSASGADYGSITGSVTVNVSDNDTADLTLSTSSISITEGSSGNFTVQLATQPSENVTITLSGTDGTDLSLDKTSLTFTATNWNVAQRIVVSAGEDDDTVNDSGRIDLSASGADYDGVTGGVDVNVTDNDTAGLTITPVSLTIGEGSSGNFTVQLATQPSENVTITLSGTDGTDLSPDKTSLTFTATNWNVAQRIVVSAGEDDDTVNDSGRIDLSASGADYDGVTGVVDVNVTDNDTAGLTITPVSLTIGEGSSGNFTVQLATQPSENVTITLSGTDGTDLSLDKTSLTFTATNWNVAQRIVVSAGEDDDTVNDSGRIDLSASGADYDGVTGVVDVNVTDNDTAGLTITPVSLTIGEGSSGNFTVQLATQPSENVTITLSGTDGTDLSLDKTSLTFTATNWNVAQRIVVSAGEDDDTVNDSGRIDLSASGADYDGVTGVVDVNVTDNDAAGLTIMPVSLTIGEGSSGNFTVQLATQPSENVTITLSGTDGTDLSLDKTSLTFTATNWNVAQRIVVSAGEDDDTVNDSGRIDLSASGADYDGVTGVVDVNVTDNDTAGLTITPVSLTIGEGSSGNFTVQLATQPSESVMVTLSGTTGTDLSLDTTTLTFTATNWNVAQRIVVSAGEDDDTVNDSGRIDLSASGADYDGVTGGVDVNVTDNDTAGLTITPVSLTIGEGSSGNFTVQLATQPSENVTITLSGTDSTDLSLDKTSLTFTATNWNVAQRIVVSAGEDDDTVNDSGRIDLSASGADYDGVTGVVDVNVTDNDAAGLTITPVSLTIGEGSSGNFTVQLVTQPSENVTVTLSGTTGTDLSLDTTTLTFTATNWNVAQRIVVSAGEDDDTVNDSGRIDLSASGADYGSITGSVTVNVSDNDTADLTLSTSSISITEGSSGNFTVQLATQPSENVTVTLSGTAGTDLSLDKTSLTFTATNWNVAQRIVVSAGEDDDTVNDSGRIDLSASGADYDGVTGVVDVNVTDNDAAGLTITPVSLTIGEGSSGNFTVQLATQPSENVTITLSGTDGTDLSLDKTSLTFTSSNWNMAQTVIVNAGEDDDTVNDSGRIDLSASGADYGSITGSVTVNVSDNDTADLTLSTSSISITEGSSGNFTVQLATQPSENVTITLSGTDGTDLSLDKTSLTFTATNWNMAQRIVVSAGEDDDTVNDSGRIDLSASGADYGSITGSVTVNVSDNDTADLTLSTSSISITEGSSGNFTVQLATQPSENVTITLSGTDGTDLSLDKTSLTFTATNWNVAQTVIVNAGEDNDTLADSAVIDLSASGADYGSITGSVTVNVSDNDTADLTLSTSSISITEGSSGNFTVQLATQPSENVTITLSGTDGTDLSLDKTSLTFTSSNWNMAQTVIVNAGEDDDTVNDSGRIDLSASGADYDGVTGVVDVNVTDNDAAGLTITPVSLTIGEGSSGNFTVQLVTQPSENVTVTLSGTTGTDLSLDTTTLTFTATNWNVAQRIVVSAGEDDDTVNDSGRIDLSASGADYDGVTGVVDVNVTDNDTAGLTIMPVSLTIGEGSSGNFTVQLATQPSENVTITLSGTDGTDLSLDKTSLTFTATNWNMAQTVIVNAGEDNDTLADSAVIDLSASGADYDGVTGGVDVNVTDNDTAGLTIMPVSLTIGEGSSGNFTVQLATQPSENVTITLSGTDGTDLSLDKTSLTFTATNWNVAQRIVVSAGEDDDTVNDSGRIGLSASGADYDGVTGVVDVNVTDNDTAGLTITPVSLTIGEGSSGNFTVQLAAQPSENVTITLSGTDGTDLSPDKTSLTFTATNWNVAQRIVVSAGEDDDTVNDSGRIGLSASGADYDGVTGGVDVNVTDNDTAGLTITPVSLTIGEGSSGNFTVQLVTQPSENVTVTLSGTTGTDLSLDTTTLTFTATNWNVAQRIVVSAGEDDDTVNDSGRIDLSASGADYDGVTGVVDVNVTDNDNLGGILPNSSPIFGVQIQADLNLVQGIAMTPVTLPLAIGGDGPLQYRITPSLPFGLRFDAATRQISGTPGIVGTTHHNYIVSDSDSNTRAEDQASLSFAINVAIGPTTRAAQAWVSRFGRSVGQQVVEGIRQRVRAVSDSQSSAVQQQIRLDGQSIDLNQPLSNTAAGLLKQLDQRDSSNLLYSSGFSVSGTQGGGQLSLWGQGAYSGFSARDNGVDLEGRVNSLTLGSDYRRDNWAAGALLSRSKGEGDYRGAGASGELESDLTSIVPWGSIQMSEELSVWGAMGQGQGELRLKPAQESEIKTDLDWQMLAGGVQSRLIKPDESNRLGLSLTGDLLWTETTTDRVARLQVVEGETRRVRLGLEADWRSSGGLTPKLELGIRHDSGDAETGLGVELGGGLVWQDGWGNRLELNGRSLLDHNDSDFRDWGVSIVAQHDARPSSHRGFSARLSHQLGNSAEGGIARLFNEDTLSLEQPTAGYRWDLELAYGIARARGLTGSGYMSLSGGAGSGLGWRVGYRLQPEHTSEFEVDLHLLDAREAGEADPGVGLRFIWR